MPVRAIPRNYRSVTGKQFVPGLGRHVGFESTLERDFIMLCRFIPGFVDIDEQPVKVPLGHGQSYVPDFLVTWKGGRRPDLVEVKPEKVLAEQSAKLEPRFAAARQMAADNGWAFRIATEKSIRTPRLENARFLLPFHDRVVDEDICRRLTSALAGGRTCSLGAVLGSAFPNSKEIPKALPALWHLVATMRIAVDLDQPLTMKSETTLAQGEVQ